MTSQTPQVPSTPLRRMREAAGLSIRELEARTGINRGRLSIIERGVGATEDEWKRITAALADGFRQGDAA